ncbi:hypothetical protein CGLAU_00925 [Corynebacterium glaucum]|uniref:DUF1963 domain-containing protein n=1 Tax=Corynebacterium glaucum TaxID=187491 RepID=A0A1Q2HTL5_9CORY|nr:YwqG family protein [Corynebacterium glaucum]AQQ14179.1 hypothetical protein CGLAU_00925 [Corynebacterium glaucum]
MTEPTEPTESTPPPLPWNYTLFDFDADTTRPVIDLDLAPERPDTPTTSKIGGTPYLPESHPFPEDEAGPMLFIAQFNFDELPELPDFPTTGILQLFVRNDSLMGLDSPPLARYIEHVDAPHTGSLPSYEDYPGPMEDPEEGMPLTGTLTTMTPTFNCKDAWEIGSESGHVFLRRGEEFMTLHATDEHIVVRRGTDTGVPQIQELEARTRFPDGEWLNPTQVQEKIASLVAEAEADGFAVDESMQERIVDAPFGFGFIFALGGYPSFVQLDRRPPGDPTVCLAHIGSDEETIMFEDYGAANFFIHPDDLRARDFSRVTFSWDSA